jgi:hypothetical protein
MAQARSVHPLSQPRIQILFSSHHSGGLGYRQTRYAHVVCPRDGHGSRIVASGRAGTGWKEPECLDTLAAAHAETGDFERAVKRETQAIQLANDVATKQVFRFRLKHYEQKNPYREPNL